MLNTILRVGFALFVAGCLATASISADERDRSVTTAMQVTQTEPVSSFASSEPLSAVARTELPNGTSELPLMLLLGLCALGLAVGLMVATTRAQR